MGDEPSNQTSQARTIRTLLSDSRTTLVDDRFLTAAITVCVVVGSVCSVLIAKLLDDVMGADDAAHVDPRITEWFIDRRTGELTAFFRAVTHVSNPWVVVAVVAVCSISLLWHRHPRLAGFLVASTLGTALMTTIAKIAVDRSRPPSALWLTAASGAAFPSGHAAQSVACYGALAIIGCVLVRSTGLRVLFVSLAQWRSRSVCPGCTSASTGHPMWCAAGASPPSGSPHSFSWCGRGHGSSPIDGPGCGTRETCRPGCSCAESGR